MEIYTRYWIATMARGIAALLAGLAVLVLPQMVSLIFLLPFAILLSMLCLAVYGTIDSLLLFLSSFLVPHHEAGRLALRAQGLLGVVCGILLFLFVYDHAQLPWFLYLALLQAACIAVTEFVVAKGTSVQHGSRWCFASASVAALSAIGLLVGKNLLPEGIAWLLFSYLGLLGFTLTLLSARMLIAGRQTEHLAPQHAAVLATAQ
jgi:hypothetical protein